MFDAEGNKTEMYGRVKLANEMIAAVDEVLMCAKSEGVIVKGVMPQLNRGEERMSIPEGDLHRRDVQRNFRPFLPITPSSDVSTTTAKRLFTS